jgi:hypothetical protein
MKTSEIFKLVLDIYEDRYRDGYKRGLPGICENLLRVIIDSGTNSNERSMTHRLCKNVLERYKPEDASLYWWHPDDVETRKKVLRQIINDLESEGE